MPAVLTMAATDVLDQALLRPGRFDRKITGDRPSADGRGEIIEYYLANVKHDPNLPIDYVVYDANFTIVIPEPLPEPVWTEEDERRALAETSVYPPPRITEPRPAVADGQ